MIGNDSLKIPQIYRKEKEKLGSEKNIFEISKTRKISLRIWGKERKTLGGWNVCWNWRIPRVMTSFTDFTWNVSLDSNKIPSRGKWSRGCEIFRFIIRLLAGLPQLPVDARQIKNRDLGLDGFTQRSFRIRETCS